MFRSFFSEPAFEGLNSQIEISDIVSTIRVPTLVIHRTGDTNVNVEAGRFLAKHIPGARYLELPGIDHVPFVGDNASEVKSTGDGILATFDGPARGVRCACTIADEIKPLGINVRAGLHTGECEMIGDDGPR